MDKHWYILIGLLLLLNILVIIRIILDYLYKKKNNVSFISRYEKFDSNDIEWKVSSDNPPNKFEQMEKSIPIFVEMEKCGIGIAGLDFEDELAVEECFYRADDFILLDELEKAVDEYKNVLEISPNNFDAFICLGDLYAKISKFNQAIDTYKSALELGPNDDAIHLKLGKVYDKMEDRENAIKHYTAAYEANHTNAEALEGIEKLFYLEQEMLRGGVW